MTLALLLAALVLSRSGPAPDWRPLDPENTLVIDTTKGRLIVEMRPDLAPLAVARIKRLSRERVYDGLLFHRVIARFVDQTGNPNNHDGGGSRYPDLPAEFDARTPKDRVVPVARPDGAVVGFMGSSPVEAAGLPTPDGAVRTWGLYCAGVAGMGRQAAFDSANSEIFFMREPARRLDHLYTVWGRVIVGEPVLRAIAVGEPPSAPDRMLAVRLAADLPAAERPSLEILNERGAGFRRLVLEARERKGADFSPCDISPPTRER